MLEQLLKNPAFAEMYKNAPHLNKVDLPKLTSGGIIPTNLVIPTAVQSPVTIPTSLNIPPTKNGKFKWVLPVIILVGGMYALYQITKRIEEDNNKSFNNKI